MPCKPRPPDGRITEWLQPEAEDDTQWGRISNLTWLRLEVDRMRRAGNTRIQIVNDARGYVALYDPELIVDIGA